MNLSPPRAGYFGKWPWEDQGPYFDRKARFVSYAGAETYSWVSAEIKASGRAKRSSKMPCSGKLEFLWYLKIILFIFLRYLTLVTLRPTKSDRDTRLEWGVDPMLRSGSVFRDITSVRDPTETEGGASLETHSEILY